MVKGGVPTAKEEVTRESALSCTFCGPGTWATGQVVTDDCVLFTCDRHHVEMGQAKIIRLERMRGKEIWKEIEYEAGLLYKTDTDIEENYDREGDTD